MHACMRACAYMCVKAHASAFTHIRVCLCVHLCTQVCVHVCVRVQGCVHVCARVQGWVHAQRVKSVRVSFLFLHHLRPGNPQWGWLACPAHTLTLVLLVLLLLNTLLSNRWLLLNHNGFPSTRDTAVQ